MSWKGKALWFAVWMICVYVGLFAIYSRLPDRPEKPPTGQCVLGEQVVGAVLVQLAEAMKRMFVALEFFFWLMTLPIHGGRWVLA